MSEIRKARYEDFERVYPLLTQLRVPGIEKEDWRQLFVNHWRCPEDFCGYLLIDRDEVVGFLGTIFSRQTIGDKPYKFCNLSSWVVRPGYRAESLLLLLEVLKLKDYTLTDFTATKDAYVILKKMGFEDGESHLICVPFFRSSLRPLAVRFLLEDNKDEIGRHLSGKDAGIFHDHADFKCHHVLLRIGGQQSYLILTRIVKKGIPFAMVHYVNNVSVFMDGLEQILARVCWKLKAAGLLIHEGSLQGRKMKYSIRIRLKQPRLFKSESLKREDFNALYSECIILNQ